MTIHEAFQAALLHHQSGRLPDAEALYRQILAADPNHPDALHLLGVIAHQLGHHHDAIHLIQHAISLNPNSPDFHSNLGEACRASGLLDNAIAAFQLAVSLNPTFPEAHNNLGNALRDKGHLDDAIAACRRAIALRPTFPEAHNSLGNALRDKGHLDEAIIAFRQAIALKPGFPDAHSNLGNALRDKGRLGEAITSYRQAITVKPDYAEAHSNLGSALMDNGQVDQAIAAFHQAIALKPDYAEAHSNLGVAFKDAGRTDEAITAYRQAIALKPNYAEAHSNLGHALREQGRLDEAIASCRQAITLKPGDAKAHSNLGSALIDKNQPDEAIAAYHQAIALNPDYAEARYNLGNALRDKGRPSEAIASYRQAIALKPHFPAAFNNLCAALRDKGQPDEAIAACRQAIALNPDYPEAHSNLGNILKDAGLLDEAVTCFRRALELDPTRSAIHSNLLLTLTYHPGFDAQAIAKEQHRWNRQHGEPLRSLLEPHANERNPNRRLRIGYVSPDFREHAVGYNLAPLLAHRNCEDFEVFCYAQVARPDALTERFRSSADHWCNTIGLTNEQLAAQIRADRIDILVDTASHTEQNRLPVFARKPAPVQIAWQGFPGSTGLDTIDYRLSDPHLDPMGMDESIYSEKTVRLPQSFWCHDLLDCGDIPVGQLPAEVNGFITFGCLNNFCKINDGVLRLWSQVLKVVPASRLLLLAAEGGHRQHALDVLRQEGITSERVEFASHQPRRKYLELYHRIDLGMDTLPYNGHTTSLDSFWMGVPVVTLVGQTIVGRGGLSQLMNLGLPELVSQTPDQYIQIAADLANDLPRLALLRSSLRQRMLASPLMDAPRFALNVEAAFRLAWSHWCSHSP